MIRVRVLAGLACLSVAAAVSGEERDSDSSLSERCPPAFELVTDGTCEFRSLYALYQAPFESGGLRVPLPSHRGGYTPQQIDLGRLLFFDPLLSRGRDKSCASCHRPDLAFADGGANPAAGDTDIPSRDTPSLWNAGFLQSLNWDGSKSSLEEQVLQPLLAPQEMGNSEDLLEAALSELPSYCALFTRAFGPLVGGRVTIDLVTRALAAFVSSLVSVNSRYDRYAHGDEMALTDLEKHGHNVFRSFRNRCSQCHTPPMFTNQVLAVVGAPEPLGHPFDSGAAEHSGRAEERGAFRVPSLRNVARTAPYMHSGALGSLLEVVQFYDAGRGNSAPRGEVLFFHWHVPPKLGLSLHDQQALVAFMEALTDESLMPVIPQAVPSGLPVTVDR